MIRKFTKWAVIIVCIQIIALTFLNWYWLNEDSPIRTRIASSEEAGGLDSERILRTYKVPLPAGEYSSIGLSYDQKYLAYGTEEQGIGVIKVKEVGTKKGPATVSLPEGSTLDYLRWLPDRHRLFYMVSINSTSRYTTELQLWYYDETLGKSSMVKSLGDLTYGSKPRFMTLSTYTNLIYLTVDDPEGYSSLYRIDIMGDCRKLRLRRRMIAGLCVLPKDDVAYIEEGETGRILVLYKGTLSYMADADGEDLKGSIKGLNKQEELVIAKYSSDMPASAIEKLLFADQEGQLTGALDLGGVSAINSIGVSGKGNLMHIYRSSSDSISIYTWDKRPMWSFRGTLIEADADKLAYIEPPGKTGIQNVIVKKKE